MDLGSADIERRRFRVKRKGYDPDEVTLYLYQVAAAMDQLEAAARIAQERIHELERHIRDLRRQSENGFHQAVASSSIDGQELAQTEDIASSEEAIRLIDEAADKASRIRKQAEATLEDALSTTAQIIDDQARLLADARAGREALVADAKAEADAIVTDAKETAANTRSEAQRFAEELRELTAAESIELVTYAKAMAASILEAASGAKVQVSIGDDDVTIDLTEPSPKPAEVEWAGGAGLPHSEADESSEP